MSLLFPEQLRIGLGASYAAMARVNGSKVTDWRLQTWDADPVSTTPWQRALSTVAGWQGESPVRGTRVTVTLSTELAPLHLLPWRDDATRSEQQALLAAAHFRRVYGETVEFWKTTVQPGGHGNPWVGSAMDERLLQTLTQQLQAAGAHLASVAPLPVSVANSLAHHLTAPACWLLVPEPEQITLLHFRMGQWSLLQSMPMAALRQEPLAGVLLRETRLAGLPDTGTTIYLACTGRADPYFDSACTLLDPGWQPALEVPPNSPLHLLGGKT